LVTGGDAGFHHPAVRAARLLHNKKHRLARRCFLIEGPLLFEAALGAGARIEDVFALRDDLNDTVLQRLGQLSAHVHGVDRRTLASLSQTKTPQGLVAVVAFVDRGVDDLTSIVRPAGPALILVLPNLSDPGNAGTLVRSAEAFGVSAVCFGGDAVEPYNDKVVRGSMGSLFRMPIVRYERWQELLPAVRAADLSLLASEVGGNDVRTITHSERIALVVGQERHGLAEIPGGDFETVAAVPQTHGIDSLNAGVAGSILLYELSRAIGILKP
jgi:TrmH family RNA methyltransferase